MAKVALDGTINIQGTKEIDRTNLAQLREPRTNDKGDCGRTEITILTRLFELFYCLVFCLFFNVFEVMSASLTRRIVLIALLMEGG